MSIIVKRQAELLAEAFQDIGEPTLRAQIFDLTLAIANTTRQAQTLGHTLLDLEGRVLSVDSAYCDIVGRERTRLLAMGIQDFTHPDDVLRGNALVRTMIVRDEPFMIVKRYLREDRSVVWVENQVALMKDGAGPDRIVISSMPLFALPANDTCPSAA